jgi:hypothetical protein
MGIQSTDQKGRIPVKTYSSFLLGTTVTLKSIRDIAGELPERKGQSLARKG